MNPPAKVPTVFETFDMDLPRDDVSGQLIEDYYGVQYRYREVADKGPWTQLPTVVFPDTEIRIQFPSAGAFDVECRVGLHAALPRGGDPTFTGQSAGASRIAPFQVDWSEWSPAYGLKVRATPCKRPAAPYLKRDCECVS